MSSSWLTSDTSLGRVTFSLEVALDDEASLIATPLADLGLSDSSPLCLCCLLSLLMLLSCFPVEINDKVV